MNLKGIVIVCVFLWTSVHLEAQKYFRITGNYSIKAKTFEGKPQLTSGKFYYDRNFKKLVYCNSFPSSDLWVSYDTLIYRIVDNHIVKKYPSPPISQFSIFHLVLTGQIKNYGLKASGFTIQKVEKNKDLVITTWIPPQYLEKMFGKVLVSVKENRLYGIIFIDASGTILKKQFFDKYENITGVEFPLEVVDITYVSGKENYQITTYKNILVDEVYSNNYYNYTIPY